MRKIITVLALNTTALLIGCGSSIDESQTAPGQGAIEATAVPVVPSQIAEASSTPHPVEACKGAIGTIMGRDPSTMKGKKLDDGIVHVSYVRPEDGKQWQARCRIDDSSHLTWAAFDAFGDGQQGRWRNEDTIEFAINGSDMRVKQSMGGELVSEETFSLSELK